MNRERGKLKQSFICFKKLKRVVKLSHRELAAARAGGQEGNSVGLMVVFLFCPLDGKGPMHYGVCSTWLSQLSPGEMVPAFVRR